MNEPPGVNPPSTLVIEYKSESLIIRAIVLITIIVATGAYFMVTNPMQNMFGVILLGVTLIIPILMIKKAKRDTALIVTEEGMKIEDKYNVTWNYISRFYIKTVRSEDRETEIIVIDTKYKNFELIIPDLELDRDRLNRWISYYKKQRQAPLK